LLVDFECFDVFTDPSGAKLAADRKSLAEEIDAAHQRVLNALSEKAGVRFR
jgi:phenylalanyl-tRNA synthetase beta chain